MEAVSIDLDMKRITNDKFVKTAVECTPDLLKKEVKPAAIVTIDTDEAGNGVITAEKPIEMLSKIQMGKGDKLCLDFGHHQVGHIKLKLSSVGSPQDSPAFIRLKFGEVAKEITEKTEDYNGWISRGWIQEEFIHIDVLPALLELPRRYAFRFLEIETIDTSLKWRLVINDVVCESVSAVDMEKVPSYQMSEQGLEDIKNAEGVDMEFIKSMEDASLRTLQNCMQEVFEDGPKRDRRLWLGDLRLQAKADYETFKNYELVKRCLYLFAGLTRDDGKVGACLFTEPEYIVDDTFFFDYSLFFVSSLYDYYKETNDLETLKELWPCAKRQIELARKSINEKNLVEIEGDFTCFIDWKEGLDKHASAQAVYIYCARQGLELAKSLGEAETAKQLENEIEVMRTAAINAYWNEEKGLFMSGGQISYASQVWMILAGAVTKEQGKEILVRVTKAKDALGMLTPYMNHHFVEALILCGMRKEALEYLKYYWGGMLNQGADTFWEMYNPKDPTESPYGSSIVNSYCHAWSCTPTYLLRKYF